MEQRKPDEGPDREHSADEPAGVKTVRGIVGFVIVAGLAAAVLLLLGQLAARSDRPAADKAPPSEAPAVTAEQDSAPVENVVRVEIHYGDGAELHFRDLPWQAGMTALEATLQTAEHPRGPRLTREGSGATAFISAIDDLRNERGGSGRNWIFYVNSQKAEISSGVAPLEPGDVVQWRFQPFEAG